MCESNQQSHVTTNAAYAQSETVANLTFHCVSCKCTNSVPRNRFCYGKHTGCKRNYKSLSNCMLPQNRCKKKEASDIFPERDNSIAQSSLAVVEYSQQASLKSGNSPNTLVSTWQHRKLLTSLRQSLFRSHHVNSGIKPKIIFGGTYPIDKPLSFRSKPVTTFNVDTPVVQSSPEIMS